MKFKPFVVAVFATFCVNVSSSFAESMPWLGLYVVDKSKAESTGVAAMPMPSFSFEEGDKFAITLNDRVMAEGTYTVKGLEVTIENSGKKQTGRFSEDYRYFGLDGGEEMAYVKAV